MKISILLSLILLSAISFSQNPTQIKNQIDSLKAIRTQLDSQIQKVDLQLRDLEQKLTVEQFKNTQSFDYLINQKLQIKIRDKDNSSGNIIYLPRNGETIKLLDFNPESKYWSVSISSKFGYVNEVFIQGIPQIEEFKKNISSIKKNKKLEENKKIQESVKTALANKYGIFNSERILNHQYWIGMTDEMARESLGSPDDINRTTGTWGVHEQWVYEKKELYLYFENGELTSFQDK
jgi:hypothetical protein